MREYETVLVLDATLDETRVNQELDTVGKVITDGGGEVLDVQRWGRRRLAYEIQKKREGIYSLVRFKSEPPVIDELERRFRLNDSLLRHLTVLSHGPAAIPGYDERDRDDYREGRGDRRGGFRDGDRGRDRDRDDDHHAEGGRRPRRGGRAAAPAVADDSNEEPARGGARERGARVAEEDTDADRGGERNDDTGGDNND